MALYQWYGPCGTPRAHFRLLLGQAPVDADREDVIATWVDMVMGLIERAEAA